MPTLETLQEDDTVSQVVDTQEIVDAENDIYVFEEDTPDGNWYFVMNGEVITEMQKENNWRNTMRVYIQGFADAIEYTADQLESSTF